jgi:hypothetical protein
MKGDDDALRRCHLSTRSAVRPQGRRPGQPSSLPRMARSGSPAGWSRTSTSAASGRKAAVRAEVPETPHQRGHPSRRTTATPCPKCSPNRRKKRDPCLHVTIERARSAANCFHCDFGEPCFDDDERRDDATLEARGLDVELATGWASPASVAMVVKRWSSRSSATARSSGGSIGSSTARRASGRPTRAASDRLQRGLPARRDKLLSQPLIITEGEFDAIAAIQCGLPARSASRRRAAARRAQPRRPGGRREVRLAEGHQAVPDQGAGRPRSSSPPTATTTARRCCRTCRSCWAASAASS